MKHEADLESALESGKELKVNKIETPPANYQELESGKELKDTGNTHNHLIFLKCLESGKELKVFDGASELINLLDWNPERN